MYKVFMSLTFAEKSSTLEAIFDGLGSTGNRFRYNVNVATSRSPAAARRNLPIGSTDFGVG